MNIIIYRYRSICEPDFIDAFKALGLDVIEDKQGMESELSLDDRIIHLGNLIADNRPLFVFSINFYPFISMLCEKLHVFYVAVSVDCPVFEIFNTSIRSKFNRLFLFDKNQYDMIHKENPDCVFHMPLGAAASRLTTLLGDTYNYKYDISFVGSLYNEKDPLIKLLNSGAFNDSTQKFIDDSIDIQLNNEVFGYEKIKECLTPDIISDLKKADSDFYPSDMSVFDISEYVALNDYLSPHATYIERVKIMNMIAASNNKMHLFTQSNTQDLSDKVILHGGVDSLKEMPFVFRQSKINLNITTRSISSGLSQRIWDVLACKGFLITNYQPEIDLFFKDGVHLVTYHSYDELIEKINYYLEHEQERNEIAQQGYEEVCANAQVVNRVLEIFRIITGSN